MRTIALVLITAACSLALLGMPGQVWAAEDAPTAESNAAGADDPILATVDGHPIRQSDVAHLYQQRLASGATGPGALDQGELVEELIRRESIRHFILASDIKVEPSVIDARLEQMKQRLAATGITFADVLKAQQLTEEEFKEIIFVQLGLEKLAESRLTEEELDSIEEQVRASHILVSITDEVSDEEAKKKILFIKKEIESGQSFEECAKAYSYCPSKVKGGDLGFFLRKGAMVEPFAKAAYALKVGEVSGPVRTQFGYHLIKVTDRSKEPSQKQLLDRKLPEIIREIYDKVEVKRFYKEGSVEEKAPSENKEEPSTEDAEERL